MTQGMQKTDALCGKEIESRRDGETKGREMAAAAGWIATATTTSLAGKRGSGPGTGCMRDAMPKRGWARCMRGDVASQGKGYGETGGDIESREETSWSLPWATRDQAEAGLGMS